MIIATWNLNNRVGKVRFRPEAASAACAIGADLVVFTEFYPQAHEQVFRAALSASGFPHQLMSKESLEPANRVLIASRLPIEPLALRLPDADQQFPSNVLGITVPSEGLNVLGLRVPTYVGATGRQLLLGAWEWIERTAASLADSPAIMLGDFNATTTARQSLGGAHFRRVLASGWRRAEPQCPATYFSSRGFKTAIDYILATRYCHIHEADVLRETSDFLYAGSKTAISDHAVLRCTIRIV
jgi:endonuclease/exonuclease/phosphatase family metal-dependent hydrolase